MSRYIALIPAAGVGARFGAGKPKQYVDIGGQTVLQHTLDIFLTSPLIDHVAVVLSLKKTGVPPGDSATGAANSVDSASRSRLISSSVTITPRAGIGRNPVTDAARTAAGGARHGCTQTVTEGV